MSSLSRSLALENLYVATADLFWNNLPFIGSSSSSLPTVTTSKSMPLLPPPTSDVPVLATTAPFCDTSASITAANLRASAISSGSWRSLRRTYEWYWPTSPTQAQKAEWRMLSRHIKAWSDWVSSPSSNDDDGDSSSASTSLQQQQQQQRHRRATSLPIRLKPSSKKPLGVLLGDLTRAQLLHTRRRICNDKQPPETHRPQSQSTSGRRIRARLGFVDISEHAQAHSAQSAPRLINTLIIEPQHQDSPHDIDHGRPKKALVLTHGYGGGLGMWAHNLESLAEHLVPRDYGIYALDWLGMGKSSRSPLPPRPLGVSDQEYATIVESYLVDSLEAWRQKVGIDKMILTAHSAGGFLSAAYALRYPENVEKLILVSPAGLKGASSPALAPAAEAEQVQTPAAESSEPVPLWARMLWSTNTTPFALLRAAGPLGPRIVQQYTSANFRIACPDALADLQDYVYHINCDVPAGERVLTILFHPDASAHLPLADRLAASLQVPVAFMYGAHDWFPAHHAESLLPRLATPAVVKVVDDAGHQLFLDNPAKFNDTLLDLVLNWQGA
ncbi:hypothetical protein RI367_008239 [Sorochytrium milnesiophthora]